MYGPCPSNGSEVTARNCIEMDAPRGRRIGTPKVARTMVEDLKDRGRRAENWEQRRTFSVVPLATGHTECVGVIY